jgi:hypothetical protein
LSEHGPWLEPVKHGHANGDVVLDLVVDEAAFVVHDSVAEFDAAVHGAGVHEIGATLADFLQPGIADAMEAVVFTEAGTHIPPEPKPHQRALHPIVNESDSNEGLLLQTGIKTDSPENKLHHETKTNKAIGFYQQPPQKLHACLPVERQLRGSDRD